VSLVLSLFPGVGLFDAGFEAEGFCTVRGPDVLWGGDVRRFHPPSGRFDGIIGGPPCQAFSSASGGTSTAENLIPEFERVIVEAAAPWFVMENVPQAPLPVVPGYVVAATLLNNRWLGEEQNRVRRFSFGARASLSWGEFPAKAVAALRREEVALEHPIKEGCFTANGTQWEPRRDLGRGRLRGRSRSCRTNAEFQRACRLQGVPDGFLADAPFTVEGKIRVLGNGVPIPMGRAVARSVRAAIGVLQRVDGERGAA